MARAPGAAALLFTCSNHHVDSGCGVAPARSARRLESERNFFGDLALLYDSPRAATIRALTDAECWSLDRVTFKRVLMDTTIKQRQLYLDFLDQVPIFSTLSQYEKMIVADALRVQYYEQGAVIIEEGSAGDDFYIVEDGEVMCTKGEDEVSARLGSGGLLRRARAHHERAAHGDRHGRAQDQVPRAGPQDVQAPARPHAGAPAQARRPLRALHEHLPHALPVTHRQKRPRLAW